MRRLRLRALVDDYFVVVCAFVVLCVVAGGWATYGAYAGEDRRIEERTVGSVDVSGEYDHAATVTAENELYPVGTSLEDRSMYFTRISPVVNGTLSLSLATSGEGTVSATAVSERIVRSTGSDDTVYWERSETIDETRVEDANSNPKVPIEFAVNVTESQDEVASIEEALDSDPGTPEVVVVTTVDVAGELEGQSVDRTLEYRFTVTYGGGTYEVESSETPSETIELTESESVLESPGVVEGVIAPAVSVVALVTSVGLLVGRRRDAFALNEEERRWLAYRDDRDEFDEWITTFRLPAEVHDRPSAEAETLRDLVDLAIDTNGAVVESPDESAYYVTSGDLLYEFRPPSNPTTAGSMHESTTATDSIVGSPDDRPREGADERGAVQGAGEREGDGTPRPVETADAPPAGLDAPLEVEPLVPDGTELRYEEAAEERPSGSPSIDEPWATFEPDSDEPAENGREADRAAGELAGEADEPGAPEGADEDGAPARTGDEWTADSGEDESAAQSDDESADEAVYEGDDGRDGDELVREDGPDQGDEREDEESPDDEPAAETDDVGDADVDETTTVESEGTD